MKFDQKLYDENNPLAIKTVTDCLTSSGEFYFDIHPLEQGEKFKSHDFYLIHKETKNKVYFEVERRLSWEKDFKWQGFPDLNIPFRKASSRADVFAVINMNANAIAFIMAKEVLGSGTYYKKTKVDNYKEPEKFFSVKLNKVTFLSKRENEWRKENVN